MDTDNKREREREREPGSRSSFSLRAFSWEMLQRPEPEMLLQLSLRLVQTLRWKYQRQNSHLSPSEANLHCNCIWYPFSQLQTTTSGFWNLFLDLTNSKVQGRLASSANLLTLLTFSLLSSELQCCYTLQQMCWNYCDRWKIKRKPENPHN